jgi:nuclear factor related to kappa-B-binding protein
MYVCFAVFFDIVKLHVIFTHSKKARGAAKPRDHFLLKNDRPPHISLLCLVRDAVARLPGGVGTRLDVALLLRDSQYVHEDVNEPKLNNVVSGALDRLHSEDDPCVIYNSEQRLWVYLHRRRKLYEYCM